MTALIRTEEPFPTRERLLLRFSAKRLRSGMRKARTRVTGWIALPHSELQLKRRWPPDAADLLLRWAKVSGLASTVETSTNM